MSMTTDLGYDGQYKQLTPQTEPDHKPEES